MSNTILHLENLTAPQVAALDREKTIFVLSVSLLEIHGPHLPLGVDLFIASYFAGQLARRITEKYTGYTVVQFPSLPLGVDGITGLGTFNNSQRTLRKVLERWGAMLGAHGFKYLLIANGHGGPRHVVALEEAAAKISKKYQLKAVSFSGRIAFEFLTGKYFPEIEAKLGRQLTANEKKKFKQDSHAGWWESSMMLLLKKDFVDPEFKNLPPFILSHHRKIFKKKIENDPGYRGHPALADVAFAKATSAVLIDKSMEIVDAMLTGEELGQRAHSPLIRIPVFWTNFWVYLGLIFMLFVLLFWFLVF